MSAKALAKETEASAFAPASVNRIIRKGEITMSKNNIVVPEAKEALERFKMEAANDVDVQNHLEKI